jgi:hypothetical protein
MWPEFVNDPKSFMLSVPPLGSQFGAKKSVPCTVTGAGVVSEKSIAWKFPVTPSNVVVIQHAPYHVADTPVDGTTVTAALAFPNPGTLAVSVPDPVATPVTFTFTIVTPDGIVTVAGMVTTAGLLDARFAVSTPATGDARFSVTVCDVPAVTSIFAGRKYSEFDPLVTCT